MTTPGPVAEQTSMAPQAGVGRLRETGAKSGPNAANSEREEGFGEVLSKLQREDGQGNEESASSKGIGRPGERTNVRRDVDAQPQEGGGDSDAGSLGDFPSDADLQLTDDQCVQEASDAPRIQGPGPDAAATATVNDIAALVAPVPGQPSAGRGAHAPMQSPTTGEVTDPTAAPEAMVERKSASSAARPEVPIDDTAKGGVDDINAGRLAAGTDPVLARHGVQETTIDRSKSERADRSQRPATAAHLSMTQATDGTAALAKQLEIPAATQRPKANVLRQETHFAPVSPSSATPHAVVAVGENSKPGNGAEARGAETAGALSVDAALLSFDDSVSVAMTPAQQIAESITTEVASAPEFADRAGMTPERQAMKPALKMLHIQLQPADLGTVTVRMELKDAELTLHVEADRAETAELIRADQDTLSKLLRSAGYNVDTSSIRVAEGDRTVAAQPAGQPSTQTNLQSSPQSQSGASERHEHAQHGSTGSNDGDAGAQTSRNDTHETTTNSAGIGLYV